MSGRTISGVVPAQLQESARDAVAYEGTSMSALVAAALTLFLGLPAPARRTARYVLSSGTPEAREALLAACAQGIARAGDGMLRVQLAARGQTLKLTDPELSEEAIDAEALAAVADGRGGNFPAAPAKRRRKAA